MIKPEMCDALNAQVNAELYSAYLYHGMAAYFAAAGLPGFAQWMRVQAQEELIHATLLYDFILDRGGRVRLTDIAAPPPDWPSPAAAFDHVCSHERKVTGLIDDLVEKALALKDFASTSFLQWFVSEQVEEEASAGAVKDKIALLGDRGEAWYALDRELGTRVFTPPAIWVNKQRSTAP